MTSEDGVHYEKHYFENGLSAYDGEPVDRLAEYEDVKEQGLIVRLPCKVGGDIVYHIYTCPPEIVEHTVCGFSIEDGEIIIIDENDNRYNSNELLFTRPEAKEKLEELKRKKQ